MAFFPFHHSLLFHFTKPNLLGLHRLTSHVSHLTSHISHLAAHGDHDVVDRFLAAGAGVFDLLHDGHAGDAFAEDEGLVGADGGRGGGQEQLGSVRVGAGVLRGEVRLVGRVCGSFDWSKGVNSVRLFCGGIDGATRRGDERMPYDVFVSVGSIERRQTKLWGQKGEENVLPYSVNRPTRVLGKSFHRRRTLCRKLKCFLSHRR